MYYEYDFTELDDEFAGTQENLELIMDCIDQIDEDLSSIQESPQDKKEIIRLILRIIEQGDYIKVLGTNTLNCIPQNDEDID